MPPAEPLPAAVRDELRELVDEYRTRCLWFLRPDLYPKTRDQALRMLGYIERYGDLEAFRRAGRIRQWLLQRLQRTVCRLLAEQRRRSGESYFHDTEQAVHGSWTADRARLEENGFEVRSLRERPGFVEAEVSDDRATVLMEWARDSAYRFFPLVEHPDFGLALHPFDLATNKLLAMIGRREVRDWVDLLQCDAEVQPLGYLAWAAAGKDPGFTPAAILEHVARTARFSAEEIAELDFAGAGPEPAELARRWHRALDRAPEIIEALPSGEVGTCVLLDAQELCRLPASDLSEALNEKRLRFRTGSIRGALPTIRP